MISCAQPHLSEGVTKRTRRSQRFVKAAIVAGQLISAALLISVLVGGVPSQAQAQTEITIPIDDMQGGDVIKLDQNEGPQVDGSTYFTGTANITTPSWSVQNADGTHISELNYIHEDGTSNPEDVFNPGKDCSDIDKTPHHERQCRPEKGHDDLVIYNVTYYTYVCKGQKRRISHAVPTDISCGEDAYRKDALTAREFGEEWRTRGVQPPPLPPPPPTADCNTPLKVKPTVIGRGDSANGVIWQDEAGKQYTVIYKADGTTTGFPGTPPPKPALSDMDKWQIPPGVQKRLEHDAFRYAHSLSFGNSWRIRPT
jgi:hypothetical protein